MANDFYLLVMSTNSVYYTAFFLFTFLFFNLYLLGGIRPALLQYLAEPQYETGPKLNEI